MRQRIVHDDGKQANFQNNELLNKASEAQVGQVVPDLELLN